MRETRVLLWILAFSLVSGCTGQNQDDTGPSPERVFANARIVDLDAGTISEPVTLAVSEGRILTIDPSRRTGMASDSVIDLKGAWVIPPLWDAHVHLGGDSAALTDRILPALLAHGVLNLRDMGSTLEEMALHRSVLASLPTGRAFSLLSAGPLLDGRALSWYGDLQQVIATPEEGAAQVERLAAAGVDLLKVYSGLEPPVYRAVLREARARNLPVDGHVPAPVGLGEVASGQQRTIEHLDVFTLQSCAPGGPDWFARSLDARFGSGASAYAAVFGEFWEAVDWDRCDATLARFGARQGAWTPTLVMEAFSQDRVPEGHRALASPEGRAWCETQLDGVGQVPPTDRDRAIGGLGSALQRLRSAGVELLAGTDFPNNCSVPGASVSTELGLMVTLGLTPLEALRTATLNPDRLLAPGEDGSIRADGPARFVVLAANPVEDVHAVESVVGVFADGVWYDRAALDRLREGAMRAGRVER